MRKIIASSLNNFITLTSEHSRDIPNVTFVVGSPTDVEITIVDASDSDGYSKVIKGSRDGELTSSSFNTSGIAAFSLAECMRLNDIFSNVRVGYGYTVSADIDMSRRYSITVSGGSISVYGSYYSFDSGNPAKTTLNMQATIDGSRRSLLLDKYSNDRSVKFDLSSPFENVCFRYPVSVFLMAYQTFNNVSEGLSLPYQTFTVMPTTLSKFSQVDYSAYCYEGSGMIEGFLTNQWERPYNIGEYIGLSAISNYITLNIRKKYYTNSGELLFTETDAVYSEVNDIRTDFYDVFDIIGVETRTNKTVGYVEVALIDNDGELIGERTVIYRVNEKCKENHEIFFINALGGVDSFNFIGGYEFQSSISTQTTYTQNPTDNYNNIYEYNKVASKAVDNQHIVKSGLINIGTAYWLRELSSSCNIYQFRYSDGHPEMKFIIVNDVNIPINDGDRSVEVQLTYHDGDSITE